MVFRPWSSELPALSLTPVVTVASYHVHGSSTFVEVEPKGFSVAVLPSELSVSVASIDGPTFPEEESTGARVRVELVSVALSIAFEKRALTLVLGLTPVLLSAGLTLLTLGGVPVVKDQTLSEARGLPAASRTPLLPPLMVAVYFAFGLRFTDGSKNGSKVAFLVAES